VGTVVPEIGLPCSSMAFPEKFTSRGTTVDDVTDGVVCWATEKKQSTEIVSNAKSEHLVSKPHRTHLSFIVRVEPQRANRCVKIVDAPRASASSGLIPRNSNHPLAPTARYHNLCSQGLRITPERGSVPKCIEPGVPKVNATLENLTVVPPVISTSKGVGEMGAGLPFRVTVAVPFTRNPPVIGVTSALSMVMW